MDNTINDVRQEAVASDQKDVKNNNKNANINNAKDTRIPNNNKGGNKDKVSNNTGNANSLVEFKKAMFGLNPAEVYEYIDIITSNLLSAQQVFDKKFEEYKNSSQLLTVERDSLKDKCRALTDRMTKNEDELKQLRDSAGHAQQLAKENEQLKSMISEFQSKLDTCRDLINENRTLKAQLTDYKTLRDGFEDQERKHETELNELREINKKQVYTFAQQKNEIETKFSTERLRLLKLLQVHTYHVRQSESLLKELQNQFEQSMDSLKELNID